MNRLNESIAAGLRQALGALFSLDGHGATVTRVSLDGGQPVVDLASRPPFPLPHEPAVTHVHEGQLPPRRLCRVQVNGIALRWYETAGVH